MREFVQNSDTDLLLELIRVRKRLLERQPVDADLVGKVARGGARPLRQGRPLVQPEQIGVLGVLVAHDHRDVLERGGELWRQRPERRADMLLEAHRYAGATHARLLKSRTANNP